jgi:hypothetical protein
MYFQKPFWPTCYSLFENQTTSSNTINTSIINFYGAHDYVICILMNINHADVNINTYPRYIFEVSTLKLRKSNGVVYM